MKIAVVKIGSRIVINNSSTSGGTGETLSIISMLIGSGCKIDAYTSVLDKDTPPDGFSIIEIEEGYDNINEKNYDALVIMNGNANFFGGVEDRNILLTYHIINNFKGKVFYILCDPNLTLKQIYSSVEKKPWGSKYLKENIFISRNDINIITQAMDIDAVKKLVDKNDIDFKTITYYPLEKFPLYTMKNFPIQDKYEYDISYGGTFRSGKREADMIKFYFGYPEDIRIEMFGKIEKKHFKEKLIKNLRPPVFNKPVKYDEFGNRMHKSISTVIIGDPLYKNINNLAQRIYESIRIGNIVFIDSSYDKYKRIFNTTVLQKFNLVNSRNDVIKKIKYLKDSSEAIQFLIEEQRNDINIDIDLNEYANNFKQLIEVI